MTVRQHYPISHSTCRGSGEIALKQNFALGEAGILRVWGVESAGAMVPADRALHRGIGLVLAMSPKLPPTQVCTCIPQQTRNWTNKKAGASGLGKGVTWAKSGCWF